MHNYNYNIINNDNQNNNDNNNNNNNILIIWKLVQRPTSFAGKSAQDAWQYAWQIQHTGQRNSFLKSYTNSPTHNRENQTYLFIYQCLLVLLGMPEFPNFLLG